MTPQEAFDRHYRAVFDFAYRLTGRADVAEDVTQECFLAFVRAPERFDAARGSVRTYLFAIARNLALKRHRDHGSEEPLPEELAARDERGGIDVATAIAELPPLQRESLVLFEGCTLEEIATVAGVDVGTVKARLHRARERLRRRLAPYRKVGNANGTV
ncbi:MAG TPA: RNA polymerase sigma factor [Candidatus Limnocylindrales bacterium]|nr:RNA polymerase sigma factor [Candidatus Limnocylindrales bacterium]